VGAQELATSLNLIAAVTGIPPVHGVSALIQRRPVATPAEPVRDPDGNAKRRVDLRDWCGGGKMAPARKFWLTLACRDGGVEVRGRPR